MSVTKYVQDGREYWKAYVHARSTKDYNYRVQRTVFKLDSEKIALREEKRLLQEVARKVSHHAGKGLYWKDIILRWKMDAESGTLGNYGARTVYDYMSVLNVWTSQWMKVPAVSLIKADGRDLVRRMALEGCSKSYQKKIKNVINHIYEWGIEERLIVGATESPVRGLLLEKTEEKVPQILTLEEMKLFLYEAERLDHKWYPVWATAIMTGMRSGELHALTWDQVDMEKNLICVQKSYCPNLQTCGPTKGRYWRTVPISKELKEIFIELKQGKKELDHVLPRFKDWDQGYQAQVLKEFLSSIKVRLVKFHTLRACFATQMLANGISAPIVMKIGGWKKSETMDIYLRLAGVDVKGATDCLKVTHNFVKHSGNVINLFPR